LPASDRTFSRIVFQFAALALAVVCASGCRTARSTPLETGVFLGDRPSETEIRRFVSVFGKKPRYILLFYDWREIPDSRYLRNLIRLGTTPIVTVEPWNAETQEGIDPQKLFEGAYDDRLQSLRVSLQAAGGEVWLRWAHEMNGNWYPWSGTKWTREKYIAVWRYVHALFGKAGVSNVRWIFSFNAESVPATAENRFERYYPGDEVVDCIGIDGYNFGASKSSRWRSFRQIFGEAYRSAARLGKPILLTEMSSASTGGNKEKWIRQAFAEMKYMPALKGFVLFGVDKEKDWAFRPGTPDGKALKALLEGV